MNALVPIHQATNAEVYRASTDAAGLCREIVLKTAQNIQGRKYVKVEGWQAIAIAHGCAASADLVERVTDEGMSGFRATGIVRRMSDGAEIARAEGFLGDDETMWTKRPVYARRAMVQTRAISRACRSAFAHVVVLIDANLSTTPAEEVPLEGFSEPRNITPANNPPSEPIAGEVTTTPKRLSAAEAKRQDLHTKFLEKLHSFTSVEALEEWIADWDVLTETWPTSWLEPMSDKYEMHKEALKAESEADFPGVGDGGSNGVSRGESHLEAVQ